MRDRISFAGALVDGRRDLIYMLSDLERNHLKSGIRVYSNVVPWLSVFVIQLQGWREWMRIIERELHRADDLLESWTGSNYAAAVAQIRCWVCGQPLALDRHEKSGQIWSIIDPNDFRIRMVARCCRVNWGFIGFVEAQQDREAEERLAREGQK